MKKLNTALVREREAQQIKNFFCVLSLFRFKVLLVEKFWNFMRCCTIADSSHNITVYNEVWIY